MKNFKKLTIFCSLTVLLFSLGMINIDTRQLSHSQNLSQAAKSLVKMVKNGHIFNQAEAATILGANQEHLVRFLYFLINGPGPNGYPTGMDGPEGGFLGMIRDITGPDALGGGLASSGFSTCASVPATGSATMTDAEGTFKMYFETPVKTIPTGYTGAGSTFDKRVVVQFNGTTFMNIEFNCDTNVGWLLMASGENGMTTPPLRNIETYWDTQTSTAAKLELYMHYEAGEATANGNEYFISRFETETDNKYKFWITRGVNYTGTASDQGFRSAVYGNSSTDVTNALLMHSTGANGGIGNTTEDVTDNGDITAANTTTGGDVQCLLMSDISNVTEGVSGECSGLGLSIASAPVIDGTGNFSVDWVTDTTKMKAKMTTLANPTNP